MKPAMQFHRQVHQKERPFEVFDISIMDDDEKSLCGQKNIGTNKHHRITTLGFKNCYLFKEGKRTTPGIPTWSPTVVLTWPEGA